MKSMFYLAHVLLLCVPTGLGHFRKLSVTSIVRYGYSEKPKLKRAEERVHIDLICADISQ